MKIYTDSTVNKRVIKIVGTIICDICGKQSAGNDWGVTTYDVARTTVLMDTGEDYGESGNLKETSYDICPDCFRDKLMPWLAEQGAKPTVNEQDW